MSLRTFISKRTPEPKGSLNHCTYDKPVWVKAAQSGALLDPCLRPDFWRAWDQFSELPPARYDFENKL